WSDQMSARKNGLLIKLVDELPVYLIAKEQGMDFMLIDREHGVFDDSRLHDLLLFGNNIGLPTIVRLSELTKDQVAKTLDFGASGILLPMVENKTQVEQLINFAKYPLVGNRSYSGGANTNYSKKYNHKINITNANRDCQLFVQIESQTGVKNIELILNAEEINGAIIGPVDLGISLNLPDNIFSPIEEKAIRTVA